MRILFVAPRFHTNQVPLVRALIDAGHDVRFDVLFEGPTEDRSLIRPTVLEPSLGSKLRLRLQRRRPVNFATYLADHSAPGFLAYLRRLRAMRPDVVVVRDPNRPFSRRAVIVARLLCRRIVLYTQGPVHAAPSPRRDLIRSVLMRVLNASWYSPIPGNVQMPALHPKFRYVPFAADVERPPKTDWFAGGHVHILCIGKFMPGKNHLLLLAAFDDLRRTQDLRLTLVGEVSTSDHTKHHREVLEEIRRRGLDALVTVRTNVPFVEMSSLYQEHDVFVLPSHNEPASVSILEAMSHGVPVVCSTTAGTRWYVEPGESGEVFVSGDVNDLRAKLSFVVEDRPRLVRMGRRARRLAETVHHPDRVRDAFLAVITHEPVTTRAPDEVER